MKKLLLLAIIFAGSFLSGYAQCTQIQVSITSPSPVSICEGTAQSLTGNVLLTSAALNGGYTYSWIKISSGISTVLVAPTPLNIPVNVNSNIDYTGISGALTDAGTYVLHIEDGNSGTGCYTEASIVVAVNPKPVITSAAAGDACSGVAQNYEITSDIPANYTWLRGSYSTNISAQESAGFTNAITETFDNIEIVSFKIYYNITATSTTGGCKSKPFNYIVTLFPKVNPTVIISTDQAGLCKGGNITLSASPANGKSYQWKKNNINIIGATNQTFATSTTSISENFSVEMISAEMCATTTAFSSNILTTLSFPTITSPGTANICEGIEQNYLITSDIASTYTWTRAAVAGIGNGSRSSTSSLITEALSNTTSLTLVVRYNITPTSLGGCIGETFNYDVTVNPKPYITSSATGTICSGAAQNYEITSNVPSNFNWTRASVTNITPASTGTSSSALITETLTNTSTGSALVRYVITSISNAGSCAGVPFNYDVTVANEIPATVSISSNAGTTICTGTPVTFKATPGNGGTSPTYSWQSSTNSGLLPSTTDTYTSTGLVDGEVITVSITSNSSCAMPKIATNSITMHVLPELTPTVTITSNKTSVCSGNPVVFTATPAGTGITSPAPSYQWYIGNTAIYGETNSTFTTSSLRDPATSPSPGNTVHATIVSNAMCTNNIAYLSNTITITVNPGVLPGSISNGSSFCSGATPNALTELTASDALSPSYAWEQSVNPVLSAWSPAIGTPSGSGFIPQGTYTSDIYFRRIVTDASVSTACNTATSNIVHITVLSPLAAGIISDNETICAGTVPSTITETAHTTGGTGVYTYQWESSLQSGGPYTDIPNETNSSYSPDLLNSTMYFRRIETSGSCGSVYSNEVAKTVAPTILPTITIDDPGATCDGDIVLLKCKATNMGSAPKYNWYVNNTIVTALSNSFTTYNSFKPLKNGDEVWVELISSNSCTNGSSVISNKVIVDLVPCTVSNSIYTPNNTPILLQPYVSQSIPNSIDYTYLWSITDGFISTNVITGTNQISSGQQNVTYSIPNQAGFTYTWTVNGGTIASGQGTNAITVNWDKYIGTNMVRTTGSAYSVSVTETNQANESKTTTMDLNMTTTAITTSLAQSGIQFYPNPSTDAFNIVMPQSGTFVHYNITDLSGTSVASGTFTSTGGAEKITTNFNTGLYQVVLTYNDAVTCLRLNKVQ